MNSSSRKIAYILGAGFSYGTGHRARIGQGIINMPLQNTLLKELCVFNHKKIDKLNNVTKYIRKYFNPNTYRSQRERGSKRHQDLFGLSIEEIVTFFDEFLRTDHADKEKIREVVSDLQSMTAELISYLSEKGNPGHNSLLKKFVERVAQTDVLITFNWDTILDRALANNKRKKGQRFWNPEWGYGQTVRKTFAYRRRERSRSKCPKKYTKFLKLHGSINWIANTNKTINSKIITKRWKLNKEKHKEVVMMPPKMIKPEIWDTDIEFSDNKFIKYGNDAVPGFYPKLWREAQEQLERCRRIVFVGYSFPPADFAVGNMLRRAISKRKVSTQTFPEIDIVDPKAAELAERFEQSFKIKIPVENQYLSLRNYLYSTRPA